MLLIYMKNVIEYVLVNNEKLVVFKTLGKIFDADKLIFIFLDFCLRPANLVRPN